MTRAAWALWLMAPWLAAQQAEINEAMRMAASGDYARAEAALAGLAKAHPANAEVRYRWGALLLRQKKPADAARELQAAAKLEPASPLVWMALGQARLELGEHAAAADAARRASPAAKANPALQGALARFWDSLAASAREARNPAVAADAWQESIGLDGSRSGPYLALAQLFLDHRTPEPAVAVLTTAARRFADDPNVARLLGLAHYAAGDTAKALDAFLRAADLAPESDEHLASFETLIPDAGARLAEIEKRVRAFAGRNAASPVGWFLWAKCAAAREGPAAEVEKLLREAVARDDRFWPAHYELHAPLAARGEDAAAAKSLERAVELNPHHAASRYALAAVYARLGDRTRASEQRQAHHAILAREREAAEARRAAAPRLPYKLQDK